MSRSKHRNRNRNRNRKKSKSKTCGTCPSDRRRTYRLRFVREVHPLNEKREQLAFQNPDGY